jgi:hypothetical protein
VRGRDLATQRDITFAAIRFRQRAQPGITIKTFLSCVIVLPVLLFESAGMASETRVIINLSDQKVSLVQQGRITLVSPIASGKPGWSTPTGNFSIFNKDIDHRSRSFGSVLDAYGRMVDSNATPSSSEQKARARSRIHKMRAVFTIR